MILRSGTFDAMIADLKKSNKEIIIFGAGVIGTVTIPHILKQEQMLSRVVCYLDNDIGSQGQKKPVIDQQIPVFSPLYIKDKNPDDYVLILAISRFSEVLEQLEAYDWTGNWKCYLAPMMCLISFHQEGGKGVCRDYDTPVIPRKLHYMWLGGKPIPDNLQKCMDSWKRFCPDYEIIRWDEKNYDISKHLYMKQAYEHGMFGFVPDYARVDILCKYGGIYLDTDVEIKRSLDDLLYQEAFAGVEKWQTLNLGGMSGCVPGQHMMKLLLEARRKVDFMCSDGSMNRLTCGFYDTKVLINHGYIINGKVQKIEGMNVYTSDYFHAYDYMSGRIECTDDTFSIHHFNGGWLDEKMRAQNEKVRSEFEEVYVRTIESTLR